MRAARSDENQQAIVLALRGQGVSVFSLHTVGKGCPDLLCGLANQTFLIEVKRPAGPKGGLSDRGLTPDQIAFRADWRGAPVHTVRTLEDALAVVRAIRGVYALDADR